MKTKMTIKSKLLHYIVMLQYMMLHSNEEEHHQMLFNSSLVLQTKNPNSTFNINKYTSTTIIQ